MNSTQNSRSGAGGKEPKAMFENPVLEKLTRTHISAPLSILGIIALGIFIYGYLHVNVPLYIGVLLVLAGILAFTFVEYLMHRYLYHMETDTKLKKKLQYSFHGWHHDYPKDKERLALPPAVTIILSTVLFILFNLLIGKYVFSFLPGFMLGYVAYLSVHYIVHAYKPPKNVFKYLWIHHSIHHHREHDRAYGVSSPLWDYVFRTMPRSRVER
jgi:4-hydroxysphinganine ceramide fatty acyl 2-hydroxylase